MDELLMPLKEKYRVPKQGARNGKYRARIGNSHGPTPKHARRKHEVGVLPPRRVYNGAATPAEVEQYPLSKGRLKKEKEK